MGCIAASTERFALLARPAQVTTTISRGRLVWHDGRLSVEPSSGRFIPLPTHSPWLFDGLDKQPLEVRWAGPPGAVTPVDRSASSGVAGRATAGACMAAGNCHEDL